MLLLPLEVWLSIIVVAAFMTWCCHLPLEGTSSYCTSLQPMPSFDLFGLVYCKVALVHVLTLSSLVSTIPKQGQPGARRPRGDDRREDRSHTNSASRRIQTGNRMLLAQLDSVGLGNYHRSLPPVCDPCHLMPILATQYYRHPILPPCHPTLICTTQCRSSPLNVIATQYYPPVILH